MKNSPLLVGLTGGIGTGKSTVAQMFKLMGVPVYDADSMAKKLMVEDKNLIAAIKEEFGSNSFNGEELNRQFLAEKVFSSENLLEKLNALVHPIVARHFARWNSQFSNQYVIKEAALLFETGSYLDLDYVILVQSPIQTRIKRIESRDPQRSSEQILSIIERQMSVEQATDLANFIINNDEVNMLIPQVLKLQKKLIKEG